MELFITWACQFPLCQCSFLPHIYLGWILRVQGGFAHVFLGLFSPLSFPSSILLIFLDELGSYFYILVRHMNTAHKLRKQVCYCKPFSSFRNPSFIVIEIRLFSVERVLEGHLSHHSIPQEPTGNGQINMCLSTDRWLVPLLILQVVY